MADITMTPNVVIPDGDLILPDFTKHAEFKIHTAAAEIIRDDGTSNPLVRAIGSSTIQDRQKDTMEYPALQSMQKAEPGMAIFVNHSYNVPDDLVGRLDDFPAIQTQRNIADLHLQIELLTSQFQRAADLHKAIKANVRMGISTGCLIKGAEWRDKDGQRVTESNIDIWDVIEQRVFLHVMDVEPLEWSFVGIPANQRSWVQYAAQGLFRRSLRNGSPDERLAPLIRSWFYEDYKRDIGGLTDKSLQTHLQTIQARPKPEASILWMPASKEFTLTTRGGRSQTATRDQVSDLLGDMTVKPDTTKQQGPPEHAVTPPVAPEVTPTATEVQTEPTAEAETTVEATTPVAIVAASPADANFVVVDPEPEATTVPETPAEKNVDPAYAALLHVYNDLGKQLGLPARQISTKDALVSSDADAQQIITLVSQLDTLTDALGTVDLYGICALSDQLMRVLNIPDADASDGAATPMMGYRSMGMVPTLIKEGKRHSESDMQHIQAIHDHSAALGAGCAMGNNASEDPLVTGSGEIDGKSALPDVATALAALAQSLASFNLPGIESQITNTKAQLDIVQKAVATEQARSAALADANAAAQAKLDAIKTTPMGRPIPAGASTRAADTAAMPAALTASTQGDEPQNGLARRYIEGVGKCHVWPDGYMVGERPDLSKEQSMVMTQMPGGIENLFNYREGKAALVPMM